MSMDSYKILTIIAKIQKRTNLGHHFPKFVLFCLIASKNHTYKKTLSLNL